MNPHIRPLSRAERTPGPLIWDREYAQFLALRKERAEKGTQLLGEFYSEDTGDDLPVLANLTLAAAAPELLEALELLVGSFEKHRPKEYWDKARAAIAKAGGLS